MKIKIRPVYSELQGYLTQAPSAERMSVYRKEALELSKQLSGSIDELNEITGGDYNKFRTEVFSETANGFSMITLNINVYRLKLGGLISRLHGTYFADESPPFSGMPSTIINQNQHQNQTVHILLEIQSKIDEKLNKLPEGKEKTFLEKVKASLSGVSSITGLITLLLQTAKDLGLSTEQVYNLFH